MRNLFNIRTLSPFSIFLSGLCTAIAFNDGSAAWGVTFIVSGGVVVALLTAWIMENE